MPFKSQVLNIDIVEKYTNPKESNTSKKTLHTFNHCGINLHISNRLKKNDKKVMTLKRSNICK